MSSIFRPIDFESVIVENNSNVYFNVVPGVRPLQLSSIHNLKRNKNAKYQYKCPASSFVSFLFDTLGFRYRDCVNRFEMIIGPACDYFGVTVPLTYAEFINLFLTDLGFSSELYELVTPLYHDTFKHVVYER